MKAFEMRDYNLQVSDEVWGLLPFKAILKRDKSRNKEQAFKEMLFIYFYIDMRSDYLAITDSKVRAQEIIKDIGLPTDYKIDNILQEAIDFYEKRSVTIISQLFKDALISVDGLSTYLRETKELLFERDDKGKPVNNPNIIAGTLEKLPKLMRDLKAAEKEVIKEQIELEGRNKGAKVMGMFEDGFKID